MANETYKLSLLLEAKDSGASSVVGNLVKNLTKLRSESKTTQSAYSNLLKTLNRPIADKSGSKLLQTLNSIEKQSKQAGSQLGWLKNKADNLSQSAGGANKLASSIGNIEKRAQSAVSAVERLRTKSGGLDDNLPRNSRGRKRNPKDELDDVFDDRRNRRGGSFMGRAAQFNDKYLEPGRQIHDVARREYDSLKGYTDAATRLIRTEAGLKIKGLSQPQQTQAFSYIDKTAKEVKGVSRIGITEGMIDAIDTLDDVNEAGKLLPTLMKYRMNMSALFSDKFSPEQLSTHMRSTLKTLELLNVTEKGEAETNKWMQEIVKGTASTSGNVTPHETLTMLRRSKVGGKTLSPEGFRNMMTLIEDFGAPTAGTALMSLNQTLVGGVMKEAAASLFYKYGFIKPGGVEFKKGTTTPKKIEPGANILGDALMRDPAEAAKLFVEGLRKGGVNTDNMEEVRKLGYVMFGNRNSFAMMDGFVAGRVQIEKEARRQGVSADVYEQQMLLEEDKQMRRLKLLEESKAQMENFQIAIGQNLLPTANKFMEFSTPWLEFFSNNAVYAQWGAGVLIGAKALNTFGQSASIMYNAGSGLTSFFSRSGNAAAVAGTQMEGAAKKAGGLRGALSGIGGSRTVSVVASIATVIGLEEAIRRNIEGLINAGEAENSRQKILKQGDKGTNQFMKEVTVENINRQPDVIKNADGTEDYYDKVEARAERMRAIRSKALGVWDRLNQDNDLLQTYGLAKPKSFTERAADTIKANPFVSGTAELFGYPTLQHKYQVGSGMMFPDMLKGGGLTNRVLMNDTFQREAKSLNHAEILREFIRALPQKINESSPGATPEHKVGALNDILGLIKTNFAESFRFASAQMQGAGEVEQMKQQLMAGMQLTQDQASAVVKQFQDAAKVGQQGPVEFLNQLAGISNSLGPTRDLFASIQTNAGTAGDNLGKIGTPANDAGTNLGTLATATGNAVGPMNQLPGAAANTLSALNAFNGTISSFQLNVPNITVTGGQVTNTGGGRGGTGKPRIGNSGPVAKPSFLPYRKPASILGFAVGGHVEKTGLVQIHGGEDIVPARVARQYREPNTFAALRQQEKPRSVIQNIVHNADGKRGSMANLIQTARDADAVRSAKNVEFADVSSSAKSANTSQPAQITLHAPLTVTVQGGGDDNKAAQNFAAQLRQHTRMIENMLARRFDRGRERE